MLLQAVILAAGKGTRMQSDIPKPLILVDGVPMLTRVLTTLADSQVADVPVIVVGAWTDAIQRHYGAAYPYAVQAETNGTGGAAAAALAQIDTRATAAPVLILYADTPFISVASLARLHERVLATSAVLTMYTVTLDDYADWRAAFTAFGRVVRDAQGQVTHIVEYKNATEDERAIKEVNPALYCVDAAWLAGALPRIQRNELTGEYYLTDLVALAVADGHVVDTIPLPARESFGFNSKADLESAKQLS